MKIVLDTNHMFWGLMDPKTMQVTCMLTEASPVVSVDETALPEWAVKQIVESVKKNTISISVQVEELLKSDKTEVPAKVEDKPKKPRTVQKKVATSKKLKA
jgi:hypothetical protein